MTQMTIEQYGVVELTTEETAEINGGMIWPINWPVVIIKAIIDLFRR